MKKTLRKMIVTVNMASDLMCSTPASSYDTLLFFVYVHFYSEDVYSYEKTWMTSEGKESKVEERDG